MVKLKSYALLFASNKAVTMNMINPLETVSAPVLKSKGKQQ